ncbi:Di-copper centre-containing protein [Setomelanomma holmii]|uniref:tyrosinase n=1 Tax=Setomelanomma holmii TaxID=210430 RepID=A0A9P4LGD6_9PLEO|nr:Di-copper centre-containing protein [Setomelanomma holmii]
MAIPQDQAREGVVVGMKALTGDVKPRVDIDVLLTKYPDTFNLMLQAFSRLQKDSKKLGFYALAGIHGLPSEAWDDVYNKWEETFGGYCAHGVLTFPTWHRPYLSLFEQTIYLQMVDIAKTYDELHRTKYVNACKDFRLPYLDYFRPRGGQVSFPGVRGDRDPPLTSFDYDFRLPDVFNAKTVTVRIAPDDAPQDDFENPLYAYKFSEQTGQLPKQDRDSIARSYSLKQTVRWPKDLASDTHDLNALSNSLNSGREGRTKLLIKLLNSTPYQQFDDVASDRLREGDLTTTLDLVPRSPQNSRGEGSLEGSVHGNYHNLIGGRGVMSNPSVAAFDPVFWFHHANIDRYWALWAAMHPNSWFPPPSKAGDQPENQKDLLPFYKTRETAGTGTYHDSDDAKTTEFYGYYYDDFEGSPNKEALWENFVKKYEWSTRTPLHLQFTAPPAEMADSHKAVKTSPFFQPARSVSKAANHVGGGSAASTIGSLIERGTESVAATGVPIPLKASSVPQEESVISAPTTTAATKIDANFDREWYIDSRVLRSAANGSFTIYFFLALAGTLNEDPATFAASPYLAGFNHIFAAPREYCDNCGNLEAAGRIAADTTLITSLLLDYVDRADNDLTSLQPDPVKKFLAKYLRWRVVYHDTTLRDARNVPNLMVNVSAEQYHDDGTRSYENYPEIIQEILQNASTTPTANTSSV